MLAGLKHIFTIRDFYLLAFVVFVVNAVFNGILTWVEVMVRPRGLDISEAGLIGGLLMIGGMLGFLVFSSASDRMRKRKPVLMAGALLSIPFLILMAYVNGFAGLAIVSFLLGLTIMGAYPVALQYATEICYPAPEGTSQGVFTLAGQISVVAVGAMEWSNRVHGSFTPVAAGVRGRHAGGRGAGRHHEGVQADPGGEVAPGSSNSQTAEVQMTSAV